jgi:DNA-binding NarL/FixJ family response regulator
MDTISVFVISNQFLFRSGLESLLGQEARCEIVGHADAVNEAVELIKKLQDPVVILDDTSPSKENAIAAVRILRVNPSSKVIGLNLRDNQMNIYQATQIVVRSVNDLIEAVKSTESSSAKTKGKLNGLENGLSL